MRISYLAHPVGLGHSERWGNLRRARRWLAYLIGAAPDTAYTAPWWLYVSVLEETPENRERGMAADLAILRRCDEITLVGGRISPGMARELEVARLHALHVVDWTHLGEEPPEPTP